MTADQNQLTLEYLTVSTNQDIKVCRGCAEAFPLNEFLHAEKRDGTGYSYNCKKCQKRENARKAIAAITKKSIADFNKTMSGIAAKTINAPHISEYLELLMLKFGSPANFAQFHYDQLMFAAKDEPGSKRVLDGTKAIINIIESSTIHRQSAPDVASLSDEALRLEKAALLVQMIAEDESGEAVDMVLAMMNQNSGIVIDEQGTTTTDSP